jgi:hypothetical protein
VLIQADAAVDVISVNPPKISHSLFMLNPGAFSCLDAAVAPKCLLGPKTTHYGRGNLHRNSSNSPVSVERWIVGGQRCTRDRSTLNRRFERGQQIDASDTAGNSELVHATLSNVEHVEIHMQVGFGGA